MRQGRFSEAQAIGMIKERKLGVRRRRGRKRARGSTTPMPEALRPDQRWSFDFMSDTFDASRKFRMLAVNDRVAIVCNIEKGKVA